MMLRIFLLAICKVGRSLSRRRGRVEPGRDRAATGSRRRRGSRLGIGR